MGRRVVITGRGIISSIGNNCNEALTSLRENRSGIEAIPEWSGRYGFKSNVAGTIKLPSIDVLREEMGSQGRFMDISAAYSIICAKQAIEESGLTEEEIGNEKTGCIAGSSFSNSEPYSRATNYIDGRNKNMGPFEVTRSITSSVSAHLSCYFGIKGRSYSIGSACATSLHNIGHAYELIKNGTCDVVLAGGADEVSPMIASMFDGMRKVLSSNSKPEKASRPYDKDRDGFVISGGSGLVILEEYEKAKARNAMIYGEIIGFGASSDGYDIIRPNPEGDGCYRCMDEAIKSAGCSPEEIDYVNTHGTSTAAGDLAEAKAINKIFKEYSIPISSTKSLTGHGIAAAGVQELIYCLLMMGEEFIAASNNIENRDEVFNDFNIVTENKSCKLKTVLTNSFGFGGTNGSLVVRNLN